MGITTPVELVRPQLLEPGTTAQLNLEGGDVLYLTVNDHELLQRQVWSVPDNAIPAELAAVDTGNARQISWWTLGVTVGWPLRLTLDSYDDLCGEFVSDRKVTSLIEVDARDTRRTQLSGRGRTWAPYY